jgi:hypothetical protein
MIGSAWIQAMQHAGVEQVSQDRQRASVRLDKW